MLLVAVVVVRRRREAGKHQQTDASGGGKKMVMVNPAYDDPVERQTAASTSRGGRGRGQSSSPPSMTAYADPVEWQAATAQASSSGGGRGRGQSRVAPPTAYVTQSRATPPTAHVVQSSSGRVGRPTAPAHFGNLGANVKLDEDMYVADSSAPSFHSSPAYSEPSLMRTTNDYTTPTSVTPLRTAASPKATGAGRAVYNEPADIRATTADYSLATPTSATPQRGGAPSEATGGRGRGRGRGEGSPRRGGAKGSHGRGAAASGTSTLTKPTAATSTSRRLDVGATRGASASANARVLRLPSYGFEDDYAGFDTDGGAVGNNAYEEPVPLQVGADGGAVADNAYEEPAPLQEREGAYAIPDLKSKSMKPVEDE